MGLFEMSEEEEWIRAFRIAEKQQKKAGQRVVNTAIGELRKMKPENIEGVYITTKDGTTYFTF